MGTGKETAQLLGFGGSHCAGASGSGYDACDGHDHRCAESPCNRYSRAGQYSRSQVCAPVELINAELFIVDT